ncbi:4-hydroxybenzoate polyprenyltransferase [Mycobacterium rhizamassiliense]|jgi:4-hydroxybenzoate polyprenyltransferase|uniref:4-hydroxybenzoate polyprenyltransferase n=2 Tax=Mycobacterium rhizamassiliense TaxID=1841860 RepID=A0A2U3NNR1_9MYCO|nr:4-hydroxybenzoate polyprenyltransferase [Mycobacterium rhizamassiliense]
MVQTGRTAPALIRARALIMAGHPIAVTGISALTGALAAQAAPHGFGPVLTAPAMLAGQLSVGWSNDASGAPRDAAAGRTDKPIATGAISARAVWIAAFAALLAALAMSLAIGVATAIVLAVIVGANWTYNLVLKSTPADGLILVPAFGLIPAYAASTLPGHPAPTWYATAGAALLGVGGHFATVLPDLTADRVTGVKGMAQQITARWGITAARGVVLVLVLSPSVLLLLASSRPWFALGGLAAAIPLAVIATRGRGKVPLWAVIGVGAVDTVIFAVGGCSLT